MLEIEMEEGYDYPMFVSREIINDYIFNVLGLEDPVELSTVAFDEAADGFSVTISVSSRDLVKLELAGAEMEA